MVRCWLVVESLSDTEYWTFCWLSEPNSRTLCWPEVWQHEGNVLSTPSLLRHTTGRLSQNPPAYYCFPRSVTVVRLDSVFSLEFPHVEPFSTFYCIWFIPTDWSVEAERENIMFYSKHCESFRQWTPRLHCPCIPCLHPSISPDWSHGCPLSIHKLFVSQLTRLRLIRSLRSKSVSFFHSWPRQLFPTVLSPFKIKWVSAVVSTSTPLFAFQTPSSHSPPPVNLALKPANSSAVSPSAAPLW